MKKLSVRDMDLRQLQSLDAIASAGTFSRAAQQLGYTQSAVSQQIAALERAVGAPLFDRVGGSRRPELTPLGAVLAEQAADLLHRVDDAVAAVHRFQAGGSGRIDIGTFQSVSTAVLPGVLIRFRNEMPEVDIGLVEDDDHRALVAQVAQGRLDLSFVVGPVPEPMAGVVLFEDPMVVVARPQDVGDGPVKAADLGSLPIIGEQSNACQRLMDEGLAQLGVSANYVFRTSDNGAVLAMVMAGMGMALRPLLAVDQDDPRLAVRALDPPLPARIIALVWRRDRTLSPAAERVVQIAVELTTDHSGLASARSSHR